MSSIPLATHLINSMFRFQYSQYGNKMKSESTEAGATNFSFDDDNTTEDFEGIFEENSDSSSSNTNSNSGGGGSSSGAESTSSTSFSSVTEDSASRVDALTSGVKESEEDVPPLEEESGEMY